MLSLRFLHTTPAHTPFSPHSWCHIQSPGSGQEPSPTSRDDGVSRSSILLPSWPPFLPSFTTFQPASQASRAWAGAQSGTFSCHLYTIITIHTFHSIFHSETLFPILETFLIHSASQMGSRTLALTRPPPTKLPFPHHTVWCGAVQSGGNLPHRMANLGEQIITAHPRNRTKAPLPGSLISGSLTAWQWHGMA